MHIGYFFSVFAIILGSYSFLTGVGLLSFPWKKVIGVDKKEKLKRIWLILGTLLVIFGVVRFIITYIRH